MITIESMITALDNHGRTNSWDEKIVSSFATQILIGSPLTEKQGELSLKILKRYAPKLSLFFKQDVLPFIENPTYHLGLRKLNNNRQISIVEHTEWSRAIKVEFPYDEATVALIRSNKKDQTFSLWDKEEKAWFFNLCESNILVIREIIREKDFNIDLEFQSLLDQIDKICDNLENHVPMVVVEDGTPKYRNQPPQISQLKTSDFLKSFFEARKNGITVYDECLTNFLDSDIVNPWTRSFLKTETSSHFVVNSEIVELTELDDLVKYMSPALFVLPGGDEFKKIKSCFSSLTKLGINPEEMSVMFRLPNDTNKIFNDFVKEQGLNNPLSEKTKIVFVSTKIPKTIFKSKIFFNLVVNLGFHHLHYTMRDYIKNCPNVVYYTAEPVQKEINFGNL
jgi:hypothetical protein